MLWILLVAFVLLWVMRFGLAIGGMTAVGLMLGTILLFFVGLKRS